MLIIGEVAHVTLILNRGRDIESPGIQWYKRHVIPVVVGVKPLPHAGRLHERSSQLLFDGANTTANDKHQDLREVFIESLLNHTVAHELFDKNTRYVLRYLLLAPGMNLRNNVAHCYYRYQGQYSFDKIILLLCGLLRIANFRFEPLDPPAEAPIDESAPA
jgi:hypothetical protein